MSLLKSLWKKWLAIAKKIGDFQAQVLLSIFYFIFFSILGIISRIFFDPLKLKKIKKTNFSEWDYSETLEQSKLQY